MIAPRKETAWTVALTAAAALGLAVCASVLTGCAGGFHRGAMPGEPKDATYLEVDGVRVRYLDVGEGPAVVLVHGFASSLDIWTGVIARLKSTHRVIALDLKGFGWTDRPPGDYSPAAEARLVLALLDARGVEQAAFVGHSWGASVLLQLALAAPDRVTRLALYSVWAFDEQLPTLDLWARSGGMGELLFGLYYDERPDEKLAMGFYDTSLVTEKLAEDVERAMQRPGTKAAALAATRAMKYADVQKRYREIQVPVLLLWGREDGVTTVEYGERLLRELPDARLEVYPRCGHMPMIEAANPSTRDLATFLAADVPAPAPPATPEVVAPTPTEEPTP